MSLPIPLERGRTQSLQEQIYRFIRDQILHGKYPAGTQLPSTRELADGLRVSRNTAVLAYQWLVSEGYIETRPGAGTFTRSVVSDTIETIERDEGLSARADKPAVVLKCTSPLADYGSGIRSQFDFWYGRADPRQFPTKTWSRLMWETLSYARSSLSEYGPQPGNLALREAIAEYLATARGFSASPDHILITAGAQEGLNIVTRLLVEAGTTIAVENPGYGAVATLFETAGATLLPVPVDGDGLIPDNLASHRPKLIYTTPSHQFPTGVVMSLERRQALLAMAEAINAYVIEDDYDGEIIYDRPPLAALAALDRSQRVIYVGSFSKSIGAGIRLGFLVLPPELIDWAVSLKSLASYGQAWTEQAVLAEFIRRGSFRTHLRRIRTLYRARRDALTDTLRDWLGPEGGISGSESGVHLMVRLPDHMPPAARISAIARQVDVALYTPEGAGTWEPGRRAADDRRLVFGYAALTPQEIETAIRRIRVRVDREAQEAG
ncbi:MAG: PLP-dependent aminotransferase family protein [Sphingopyxis sp.]|nr:PLP-dependent aminotransferase family protein [Sphingopyxis sp.]